jgi:hypothetical protein
MCIHVISGSLGGKCLPCGHLSHVMPLACGSRSLLKNVLPGTFTDLSPCAHNTRDVLGVDGETLAYVLVGKSLAGDGGVDWGRRSLMHRRWASYVLLPWIRP